MRGGRLGGEWREMGGPGGEMGGAVGLRSLWGGVESFWGCRPSAKSGISWGAGPPKRSLILLPRRLLLFFLRGGAAPQQREEMYAVYKQAHPPTGLEFSMFCNFFSNAERNLVVAGTSQLYVYRLNHDCEVTPPPPP